MKPAVSACGGLFLLLALLWAFYDPVLTTWEVASFSTSGRDATATEQSLLRRGRGAVWALRHGAESSDEPKRLRCARLLALLGDDEYDRKLLEVLRQGERDPHAALAESLILSVWDRRNGPRPDEAAGALRAGQGKREDWDRAPQALDLLLTQYPAWASGYIERARRKLKNREVRGALDDAKAALHLEPEHFEAYALLGECYQLMDFAEAALQCFDQALAINPRLKAVLSEKFERAKKESATEREQRLLERQRELPVL